ncbi:MAG: filamentous hemagglutinin N-terminal domain-containing protein [Cyanobacteria bacterium P01_F01_bin.143]
MTKSISSALYLTFSLTTFSCLIPYTVEAQVTADGTTATTVNQVGNDFTIEQGDRIGDNLFHSFDEFSIPTLGSAVFNNANNVANIFSRVTGSNISNIDGLLGANGTANFYLINPNGIIFGENARLNLGGSFFAGTADSILFEENTEFSTSNPQGPPLLAVNIPIGLNFRDNPEEIRNRSFVQNSTGDFVGLEVATGQNLTLVGGDINFEVGAATARDGSIQLGGISEAGTVGINNDGSLNFSGNIAQANIDLNNTEIDVSGTAGGNIIVNARNIGLKDGAFVTGITEDFISGSENIQVGNITIIALENINIDNSLIINQVDFDRIGNTGDVNITTGSLSLINGAIVGNNTFGQGNAGSVKIFASDSVLIDGNNSDGIFSGFISRVGQGADGNVGGISINANTLSLKNQGQFDTRTFGQGNAGQIEISAIYLSAVNGAGINSSTFGQGDAGSIAINTDNIFLDNSFIVSGVGGNNASNIEIVGNGGNIEITTGSLNAINGSTIISSTLAQGNAGNITISAEDAVRIAGASDLEASGLGLTFSDSITAISSEVSLEAQGNGGNVYISASSLNIEDGAGISTNNLGNGIGGNINLDIRGNILLQGFSPLQINDSDFNFPSSIQTTTGNALLGVLNSGQAGNINIKANSLFMNDNSVVTSFTQAKQNAGNILIQTDDLVSLDNSSIGSAVFPGAEGNGGTIDVRAQTLNLISGGRIDAKVNGEFFNLPGGIGTGGNILINAIDSVNISGFRPEGPEIVNPLNVFQTELVGLDSSGILVSTQAGVIGKAGTIKIDTGTLNLTDSGIIEALTTNAGDAGSININVNTLSATSGGQIIGSTFSEGKAGNIIINSKSEINLSGSDPTFAMRLAKRPNIITNQGADSGIFANTTSESTGIGGSIIISNPQNLSISEGATIAVDSEGQGNGGSVFVLNTDFLSLDQGSISASTESIEGGNITLQINKDLLLSNSSNISARASNDANGGNTNINTELLVAFPNQNNDIIANANRGNGGRIEITAQSLFGIEERLSTPPNQTNDIDASTQFGLQQGSVLFNTPNLDPTSGLLELPEAVGDASDQISQNPCEQGVGSEFTVTGKGGSPSNPNETLNSNRVRVGLVDPVLSQQEQELNLGVNNISPEKLNSAVVPVQGWIFNDQGEVMLTSYKTTDTEVERTPQKIPSSCLVH